MKYLKLECPHYPLLLVHTSTNSGIKQRIFEQNSPPPEVQRYWELYLISYSESMSLAQRDQINRNETYITPQIVPFNKRITDIRDVLRVSVSDLAEIFSVSRPTIYSFISGNEPVEDADSKYRTIELLEKLCDKIESNQLPVPYNKILRRRNHEGRSLKDLLRAGDITEDTLDAFIANEIEQHQENKRRIASVSRKKSKKSINHEAFSRPAHLQ